MTKKPINKIAVIHDLSGVGKAALTNIIPILSIMEQEVCPIPTMLLSTHTGGFGKPYIVECNNYIINAFNHYSKEKIKFDGLFIGYLGTINNIDDLERCINDYSLNKSRIIFDPICADNGKLYNNFKKEYLENLVRIIPYSYVITPNYTEACLIAGCCIKKEVKENEILDLCKIINKKYKCENIIITSVPIKGGQLIGTYVYNSKKTKMIINSKLPKSYPGTGDIFASVFVGYIMQNVSIIESAEKACEFVYYTINESLRYGYNEKEGILLEPCLKKLI